MLEKPARGERNSEDGGKLKKKPENFTSLTHPRPVNLLLLH